MTNDTPRHPMVIVGAMRELNDMMLAATGTAYGWGRNDELLTELEHALKFQERERSARVLDILTRPTHRE